MVSSVRSLLFSFGIVIIVVLLIVFRTFSALRSQETEQKRIRQSRDALQKLGPAFIHLKEFESIALNFINTGDNDLLVPYDSAAQNLKSDSISIAGLAKTQPHNRPLYGVLASILHRISALTPERMRQIRLQGSSAILESNSLPGVDSFKNIAGRLEDESRQLLNTSYNRSVMLARDTFVFVRIIAVLMILVLAIGLWILIKDIRITRQTQERLQQFNRELERQVDEKIKVIRVTEEKYRRLHESLRDAYAMVNMEGRLIEFNSSFREMLGYSEEELLQKTYSQLTPSTWHEMESGIIRDQVLQNNHSQVYEKEYIHKSGRAFPVELRSFLLKNESGVPEAIWAIVRDITDRKKAEQRIETSERHLRYVLSSTGDNFYVLDKEYRVTVINEAAKINLKKAWGKTVSPGTNILDVLPGNSEEPIRESLIRVFNGELVEYELFHDRHDLPAWVLITYTPVVNEDGLIIGAHIHAKDITEQKKAALELVEAEAKFRNLVEQSLVGVYIIRDDTLVYVNPQFAQTFGYPQDALIGLAVTSIVHPADREKLTENLRVRLSGEEESLHYELRGIRKNNEEINLEVFGTRTFYQGRAAIIGTLLDITDRKRNEQEKEQARYLLNERVKELMTLYRISQVFQADKGTTADLLGEIVTILPGGMQFPGKAAARIRLGDLEMRSGDFDKEVHCQSSFFNGPEGLRGTVEVIYTEELTGRGQADPFMEEEKSMLNLVTEMLEIFLARRHESEMNKRMEAEILKQKLDEQKAVIRAIFTGEERERNKIGKELHDNVNQILASVKLYLSMMKGKDSDYVEDLLNRSVPLIDDAIQEIRNLSRSQVTPVKKINLGELIQALIDKLNETTPIVTVFEYKVRDRGISDELKLNIYRIVQEQINNILKYAAASNINISLYDQDGILHVSVRDDGRGFDTERKRRGIGISNMYNRVEAFNGEIKIISSPGNGCNVVITVPC